MELDNLTNPELDRLCAEALGWKWQGEDLIEVAGYIRYVVTRNSEFFNEVSSDFSPTTNKAQAMDLLIELTDKHDVLLEHYNDTHYVECTHKAFETMLEGKDADLLVAIVKAYIMSKGDL